MACSAADARCRFLVRIHEHTAKLRLRQMHLVGEVGHRPEAFRVRPQQARQPSALRSEAARIRVTVVEWTKSSHAGLRTRGSMSFSRTESAMGNGEQQRLHPMEGVHRTDSQSSVQPARLVTASIFPPGPYRDGSAGRPRYRTSQRTTVHAVRPTAQPRTARTPGR